MGKQHLDEARAAKRDEFYTLLPDIEAEIKFYPGAFEGKIVYCNCDDPFQSNFYKFFAREFHNLGLKSLICSCYRSQERLLWGEPNPPAIWVEYHGGREGIPDPNDLGVHTFRGDGDFRSDESIELLRRADIVVTNPPFSLFREFFDQLIEYRKKFLVIGNLNAVIYNNVFPYIKRGKIWGGGSLHGGSLYFQAPFFYNCDTCKFRIEDGNKYILVPSVRWFTNLENKEHNLRLELFKEYSAAEYPRYDNFPAINVDRVKEIPRDYSGKMGVPISFLYRYSPEQFDVLGNRRGLSVNGKNLYRRIIIRNKHPLGEHPAGAEERKESGLLWETTTQE